MAWKQIGTTAAGRPNIAPVAFGLEQLQHGPIRTYSGVVCGGSSMSVVLGPDVASPKGAGGTPTNSTSLQPLMGHLHNSSSTVKWIAGHLLNDGLGGIGTNNDNLTPLTATANKNHSTFEQHIKNMVFKCYTIDQNNKAHGSWYTVSYNVTVDSSCLANTRVAHDLYSYVYSHITITYGYRMVDKNNPAVSTVPATDMFYNQLAGVPKPSPSWSNIVKSKGAFGPMDFGPIEIHNDV